MKSVRKFFVENAGVTSVEYALIAGIVSLVVIGGASTTGTSLDASFTDVAGVVSAATP